MKISYAITVCNEFVEIQKLVLFLLTNKRVEDEIVILYDSKNGHEDIETFLRAKSVNNEIYWYSSKFENHFANWKNHLTSLCTGDYIFQIDADEMPNETFIKVLPDIINGNEKVDVMLVPRVNTVKGLTQQHIDKWRWQVDENEWVNWPDYQWRIYKNVSNIKWVNKVHEKLTGYSHYATLPSSESYCLYHHKEIKRQEKQNKFYESI